MISFSPFKHPSFSPHLPVYFLSLLIHSFCLPHPRFLSPLIPSFFSILSSLPFSLSSPALPLPFSPLIHPSSFLSFLLFSLFSHSFLSFSPRLPSLFPLTHSSSLRSPTNLFFLIPPFIHPLFFPFHLICSFVCVPLPRRRSRAEYISAFVPVC